VEKKRATMAQLQINSERFDKEKSDFCCAEFFRAALPSCVPNQSKDQGLTFGGNIHIELRTESGLMTGRRTLFFLEAEWPSEILQQKETVDIPAFYYPGVRSIHGNYDDPTKTWLTEELLPGTNVYLELQYWTTLGERMQLIQGCSKHGNIVKVHDSHPSKSKEASDSHVNWKGTSQPKIAMCFCCTPSCFKKQDPFMFARLRIGNLYFQSQWFQLVFRKSTKRKRSLPTPPEVVPVKAPKTQNEEVAIMQLQKFSTSPPPSVCNSPSRMSWNFQLPEQQKPQLSITELPKSHIPIYEPIKTQLPPAESLKQVPFVEAFQRHFLQIPEKQKTLPPLILNSESEQEVARSLLQLEETLGYRPSLSDSKLSQQWGEIERIIIEARERFFDGSVLCFDLLKCLTLQGNDYDVSKQTFIDWLTKERKVSAAETLEKVVIPLIRETWFHGIPTHQEIENRLLSLNPQGPLRYFCVSVNSSDPHLTLSFPTRNRTAVVHYAIKFEKVDGDVTFRLTDQNGLESHRYSSLHQLLEAERGILGADCVPLPRMRW